MAEDLRVVKRRKITDTTIHIVVGTEIFSIHPNILSDRSTFFKDAISKRWREGAHHGKIHLPDEDPSAARAYFEWLYDSKISSKSDKPIEQLTDDDHDAEFEDLCRMYVFGEKVADNEFCNAVVSAIAEKVDEGLDEEALKGVRYPQAKAIRILYEGTQKGCPAREMMVQFYVEHAALDWFDEDGERDCDEFLRDVCKGLVGRRVQRPAERQWERREQWFK